MNRATAWDAKQIHQLYEQAFYDLLSQAYALHRQHFALADMELCALCSIKTGRCPEDCAYCPQSAHYKTGLMPSDLMPVTEVIEQAKQAKAQGAKRFCLGAAWRKPPKKVRHLIVQMIREIKALGLESCVTLGLLDDEDVTAFKEAGLDYYNHNLDTSPDYYNNIIRTRRYTDRIDTLTKVAAAGIGVCCGGILGLGEGREHRVRLLLALSTLSSSPQSIPINQLIPIPGTPLAKQKPIDPFEFIRTIAVARLMFPTSRIRLSAGREQMTDTMQAWCFMAGANSIFIGDVLLTAKNASLSADKDLLQRLDLMPQQQGSIND